jgi:hypothetical protein
MVIMGKRIKTSIKKQDFVYHICDHSIPHFLFCQGIERLSPAMMYWLFVVLMDLKTLIVRQVKPAGFLQNGYCILFKST